MTDASAPSPVVDTITGMTAVSLDNCNLPADQLILTRVAALAAVGAQPGSYLLHIPFAARAAVTVERVQDVLVAVAPIIGTTRTLSAAVNIASALDMAINFGELAAEADAG
jgi:hypothetical protein